MQMPRGGRLLPRGHETWGHTTIRIPARLGQPVFRELITGAWLPTPPAVAGRVSLPLDRVLEACPVALLWAELS